MASLRIQRVKNENELEDKISDFITMGYKTRRRHESSAELWKVNYGGIFLHIILFCLSWGILNVLYLLYKHYSPEDAVLLKIAKTSE
jgi:hypothetical protein